MHLLLSGIVIFLTYFIGDWRNWEKYGLTIFYVITCNLVYTVLCHDTPLWKYVPDSLLRSDVLLDLLYTFVVLPSIVILFLSNYPFKKSVLKKLGYIGGWVIGSLIIFYPFFLTGRLVLQNGYQYWMDFFFYILMYSMIRFNYSRPLFSYGMSIIIIICLLQLFQIPIK